MSTVRGGRWVAAVLGVWLVLPVAARADWPWCKDCPKGSYCSFSRILFPAINRTYAFHRPLTYTYADDLHPELPLHFEPVRYRCRPVPPAVYTGNYPWFPGNMDFVTGRAPVPTPAASAEKKQ
jgi:hypothetical protein